MTKTLVITLLIRYLFKTIFHSKKPKIVEDEKILSTAINVPLKKK